MQTLNSWLTWQGTAGAPSADWRAVKSIQSAWVVATAGFTVLAVVLLLPPLVDDRLLAGVSVWTKPFKFALSLAVYFATLVCMAPLVPVDFFQRRAGRGLLALTLVPAILEMAYITLQAGLGQASHFNHTTAFHSAMYGLMGIGAVSLVAALAWLAVVIARHNRLSNPLVLAVVVGLMLSFLLGGGFGGYLSSQTGHWVNAAPSDAAGMWLTRWATDGGDLRVAHFFGLHAMQALPLFALLLPRRLPASWATSLVVAFACAYTAFATATFVEALAGQPFLSRLI